MKREERAAVFHRELGLEACRFQGFARPFPKHFHEYYVIGLVERGERTLVCRGRAYALKRGDMFLFNPGDEHACVQRDGGGLDYRSFQIGEEAMLDLAARATGRRALPAFPRNVVRDRETGEALRRLHEQVMEGTYGAGDSLERLIRLWGRPLERERGREEVEAACAFLERHYEEPIGLERLCRLVGLSKSTLLRAFARAKGVTPYCYLLNIRVAAARRLLEQGVPPVEAALRTGFSDQSHFTHSFSRFTGLSPGTYRDIFKGIYF